MSGDIWAAVAAIAAAITAALTLPIVVLTYLTTRADTKASDFNSCVDVVTKLAEAQRRTLAATTEEARQFEFRELLNLMEALASLENGGKIAPLTSNITCRFLEEAWAFLQTDPKLRSLVSSSKTGTDTFKELTDFSKTHADSIRPLVKLYEDQQASAAPNLSES